MPLLRYAMPICRHYAAPVFTLHAMLRERRHMLSYDAAFIIAAPRHRDFFAISFPLADYFIIFIFAIIHDIFMPFATLFC